MAGEAFREQWQIGLESTYGVAVAATRQLSGDPAGHLDRTRANHEIRVSTGTRDNVRGNKPRAVTAGGMFSQAYDADEIVELFLAAVQGAVTPTASAAVANPTTALTGTPSASGGVLPTGSYTYVYTDVAAGGAETAQSTASAAQAVTGPTGSVALAGILAGAAGTLQRRIYRQLAAGGYGLIAALNDNTTTTYTDTGSVTTAQSLVNGAPPAVNQTGAGANIWAFKPGLVLDSQTWEWFDGANGWQESGVYVDTLKFTWSAAANGDTKVEATLFGKDRVPHTITAALATRNPIWMEGWETLVYVDALGSTPGTTLFGTAISGTLTISNKLGRKYFANNTLATASVPFGEFMCSGDLIIEANAAGIVEYTNWDTSVDRLIRLSHGNNGAALGASALHRAINHDIPCTWTAMDLSALDAGTRVIKAAYNYKYDAINAFSYKATVVNSRSAAYV